MRIALVAPGGVGGSFGALLARAGEEVVALARGPHLDAIRTRGLALEGPLAGPPVPIAASDAAAALGPADVVLFAVKLHQAEGAARDAAPLFGPGTIGISLLNGVTGPGIIADALPGRIILPGVAYVSAVIAAPGVIRMTGGMCRMVTGAPGRDAATRARLEDLVARCGRAGIGATLSEDVEAVLWEKLVGLAANAALTAAGRVPAGLLYTDPDVLAAAEALIAEAAAVARALGVALPAGVEAGVLAMMRGFPPTMYASMYHDIARGGPIEVEGLSGHILREGRRLGVPTPHHQALYAVLKPHAGGQPALPG